MAEGMGRVLLVAAKRRNDCKVGPAVHQDIQLHELSIGRNGWPDTQ